MRIRPVAVGAGAGSVGGMVMAMWSMIALAATGDGFWTPVNLIAHTFYDQAPLNGRFDGTAALVGIAAHMMISMMLGVVIALLAGKLAHGTAATLMVAVGASIAAWVGGILIWDAVDATAFDAFTPWVLFTGHLMFGMAAGGVIAALDRNTATTVGSDRRSSDLVKV